MPVVRLKSLVNALVFGEQRPAPARQLVDVFCGFKLVAAIAQFFIAILAAEVQHMRAQLELVLGVEDGVVHLHIATWVVGLFPLNVAG